MAFNGYDPDDRDAPQRGDLGWGDDDEDTVPCPACGRAIREDTPRCPHCGEWLFGDTPAARRSRGWFWPVMIALLIAVILVMWHGLRW
jgi:predicted nucleic acid-binding Zn ribbon protein